MGLSPRGGRQARPKLSITPPDSNASPVVPARSGDSSPFRSGQSSPRRSGQNSPPRRPSQLGEGQRLLPDRSPRDSEVSNRSPMRTSCSNRSPPRHSQNCPTRDRSPRISRGRSPRNSTHSNHSNRSVGSPRRRVSTQSERSDRSWRTSSFSNVDLEQVVRASTEAQAQVVPRPVSSGH